MEQIKTTKIPPLETATVVELFNELRKRTRNCILLFSVDNRTSMEPCQSGFLHHGSISEALGLLRYGEEVISHNLHDELNAHG